MTSEILKKTMTELRRRSWMSFLQAGDLSLADEDSTVVETMGINYLGRIALAGALMIDT